MRAKLAPLCQQSNLLLRRVQALRALLGAGAAVNACSRNKGQTALHLAAYFNQGEIANALIEHGADRAIFDKDDNAAAKLACALGHALSIVLTPAIAVGVRTNNSLAYRQL